MLNYQQSVQMLYYMWIGYILSIHDGTHARRRNLDIIWAQVTVTTPVHVPHVSFFSSPFRSLTGSLFISSPYLVLISGNIDLVIIDKVTQKGAYATSRRTGEKKWNNEFVGEIRFSQLTTVRGSRWRRRYVFVHIYTECNSSFYPTSTSTITPKNKKNWNNLATLASSIYRVRRRCNVAHFSRYDECIAHRRRYRVVDNWTRLKNTSSN